MCKLYAIQGEFTKDELVKRIKEKIKIIRRTEDDGLGIALHCNNKVRTWQCGESIFDCKGDNDILQDMDDTPRMVTLAIHGRTSTSKNNDVEHSHPRPTQIGPLMHNGVVVAKFQNPFLNEAGEQEEWREDYDLDTDYLAELADRGLLDKADDYLEGYAATVVVGNDGTLIVQNQGASLVMTLRSGEVEFGTTTELCPVGNKFESMRAECFNGTIYARPIFDLEKRSWKEKFSNLTSKEGENSQKKAEHNSYPEWDGWERDPATGLYREKPEGNKKEKQEGKEVQLSLPGQNSFSPFD